MTDLAKIICKLCQSSRVQLLYQINNYRYYFCENCNTLFLHPQPTLKELTEYYKSQFEYLVSNSEQKRVKFQANLTIKNLKKMNPSGKTLLDIGSGKGFILEAARKANLIYKGVEPSKDMYEKLVSKNFDVVNIDFEKFNSKRKYDFITIVHVIEHVRNPAAIIDKSLKLLNVDGVLYIETPNLASHLYKYEAEDYTFLTPPDHLWIFSINSFKKVLQDKYELIVKTYSYPEHFVGILKKLLKKNVNKNKIVNSGQEKKFLKDSNHFNRKKLKWYLFDKVIAKLLYRILNCFNKGSILELYIIKK